MRRSVRRVAAVAATAILMLAGCGSNPDGSSGGAKTITFVAAIYTDNTQKYWTKLVEDFHKRYPDVTVKVQMVDWNNIGQQVNTMVSTKQYPDVLNIDSFSAYAENDLL